MIDRPNELEWIDSPLPDPREVPYDCSVAAWIVGDFPEEYRHIWGYAPCWPDGKVDPQKSQGIVRMIETMSPHGDQYNPVRWCGLTGYPLGCDEKVRFWAWLKMGTPGKKCPHTCEY